MTHATVNNQQSLQTDFQTLRTAAHQQPITDYASRIILLQTLTTMLKHHDKQWCQAVNQDFGHRSETETRLLELFPSLECIRYTRTHLKHWMTSQKRPVSRWFQPAKARLLPQPLGVVGIMVPWNYPIYLTIAPLVAALAAGNRVMVKLSEYTPTTNALFIQLIEQYQLTEWICIVLGNSETAQVFTTLPFAHLLFTGSTAVGKQVMRAAAENLTPVTLELGGKSPVIISPDYPNLAHAAQRIVWGKLLNAGQTCIAPDYVLVSSGQQQELLALLQHYAAKYYPSLADNPDYTAILHASHYQQLQQYVAEAEQAGASVITVNPQQESLEQLQQQQKFPFTLLSQVPPNIAVMQNEIFGPLLPILTYEQLDDALTFVGKRSHPLALYLFDINQPRIQTILNRTHSGGVTINDTILHISQESLPFGGVGHSGMGRYHGYEGFATFSQLRPIFSQSLFNSGALLTPPYRSWPIQWLLKLLLR